MTRKKKPVGKSHSPFAMIHGEPYLVVGYGTTPGHPSATLSPHIRSETLIVCRRLSDEEHALLAYKRQSADDEAWSEIVGAERRRQVSAKTS